MTLRYFNFLRKDKFIKAGSQTSYRDIFFDFFYIDFFLFSLNKPCSKNNEHKKSIV